MLTLLGDPAYSGRPRFCRGLRRNYIASRREFVGMSFDAASIAEVVEWIGKRDASAPFAYIVTPNVDHIVRLDAMPADSDVRVAYDHADYCVCDSQIVRLLARAGGVKLPLVRGSDLAQEIVSGGIPSDTRISLIGGSEAIASKLAARMPQATLSHHNPPMGLLGNAPAMAAAVAFIEANPADVVFLAVGSPQQELIAHAAQSRGLAKGTGLCIGAGIEFVTGTKQRAPKWMGAMGLEWLHRLISEPRRLWKRYLVDGMRIVPITLRWLRARSRSEVEGRTQ